MTRRDVWPLAGVLLLYVGFAAVTLMDYPPVYADEPWLLATPISILRDGSVALPMFGEDYSANLYFSAYLAPFLGALGVSIEAGRIVAVAHGAASMVLVWLVARRLGAGPRAWVAPALLVALFPFTPVTRYVRPETFEIFFALLAIWLYLRREHSRAAVVAAGAAAGFAAGMSLKSGWLLALLAVWALAFDRSLPLLGRLAAGAAAALVPLAVYVAAAPGEYVRFLRKFGGSSIFAERYQVDPVSSFSTLVSREPLRYEGFLAAVDSRLYTGCVALLVGIGLVWALRARRWDLAVLAIAPLLEFALLAENKTPAYLAVAAPGFALLAALGLARASRLVLAALVLATGLTYGAVLRRHVPEVRTTFSDVRTAYRTAPIEAGALVIGLPTAYAYYLNDPVDFRSLHYFTDFATFELDTVAEARGKLDREGRPVYLLRSQALLDTLAQFSRSGGGLPADLRRLLEERFLPVAAIRLEGTAAGDLHDEVARYAPADPG